MEEWLHLVTKDIVIVIDAMALMVVAIGTAEAFFTGLRAAFPAPASHRRFREILVRYGRWLVAGLTFELAADRGDRGVGFDTANMLPGAAGDEPPAT